MGDITNAEPRKSWPARHPLTAYFVLTFVISWTGALLVALPKLLRPDPLPQLTGILMFPAMLLGPSFTGIALTWVLDGRAGLRDLLSRLGRWRVGTWAAALLIPPALVLATLTILSASVSPVFTPNHFWFGVLFGIPAGFLEEIGWTGFAYPRLRTHIGALRGAIVLGLFWTLWHAPVINWLGTVTPHGRCWWPFFLAFGFAMTAMRVLICWLYSRTGSVLLAQLMHVSSTGALVIFSPPHVSGAEEFAWYAAYGFALWVLVGVGLKPRHLAVLLMVGISSRCSAKSVIVLIRDNNVWMAADSRLAGASGKPRLGCAIGQGKGFYWASASPSEDVPAFNLETALAKTAAMDGTLLQKMKALLERSQKPIIQQLENLQATNRTKFESVMKVANHDLLKIIFVGTENHVPTLVWATVVALNQNGRIVVTTDSVQSVIPAEVQNGVVGAGLTKDALTFLAEHHWETVADPVPLLRESLVTEAKAHSEVVGGATSILAFSEAGARWMDRGACDDQRTTHP